MAETILEKHKFEVGTEVRLREEDVEGVIIAPMQEVAVSHRRSYGELTDALSVYRTKLSALDTEVYVVATDLLKRDNAPEKIVSSGGPDKFTELERTLYNALDNWTSARISTCQSVPDFVYEALAAADRAYE